LRTAASAVTRLPIATPNTRPTFDAGSCDEQHALAGVGERHRGGAGEDVLPTALAGEKQMSWRLVENSRRSPVHSAAAAARSAAATTGHRRLLLGRLDAAKRASSRASDMAGERDLPVDEDQRQRLRAGALEEALTAAFCANASGCWERLARWICAPCCFAQATSAAKLTSAWSTSVPHTPVLQQNAGSKTSIVVIGCLLGSEIGGRKPAAARPSAPRWRIGRATVS
jgi:hypothetical protein